jgi:Trypsin
MRFILLSLIILAFLGNRSRAADEFKEIRGQSLPGFDLTARTLEPFFSIVNGIITKDYPAVGALLKTTDGQKLIEGCTATLVGCRWLLTAAHCGVKQDAPNLRIFFQHLGFMKVASFRPYPGFKTKCPTGQDICSPGDIALVELASAVNGISSLPITRTQPVPIGDVGTIIGFGFSQGSKKDYGIKRRGGVSTQHCTNFLAGGDSSWLCWKYLDGSSSDTCGGDSGGPYLASNGAVGGATSTGSQALCNPTDVAFDTRVQAYADWLSSTVGPELGAGNCGSSPQAGTPSAPSSQVVNQTYRPDGTKITHTTSIGADVSILKVALSGTGQHFNAVSDVSLSARKPGQMTLTDVRCNAARIGNFAFCEIASPEPGDWTIVVSLRTENPDSEAPFLYQLVVTTVY